MFTSTVYNFHGCDKIILMIMSESLYSLGPYITSTDAIRNTMMMSNLNSPYRIPRMRKDKRDYVYMLTSSVYIVSVSQGIVRRDNLKSRDHNVYRNWFSLSYIVMTLRHIPINKK